MDLLYAKRSLRGHVFRIEDGGYDSRGTDGGADGGFGLLGQDLGGTGLTSGILGSDKAGGPGRSSAQNQVDYDAMTAGNRAKVDMLGSILGIPGRFAAGLFGKQIAEAMTNSQLTGGGGSNSNGFDGGGDGAGSGSGGAGGGGSLADIIADAMSHDPSSQAFNTTKSAWDDWLKQKPTMQTQVDTLGTRGDAAYNNSVTSAAGLQTLSNNAVSDYDTVFRPNYQRLDTEVQRYGSQAYQDQVSNEAMSGVQSNIDSQRMQLQRNRNRMGANPNSVGMDAQIAIGAATAKAAAARDAVFGAKKAYTDGLTGMSSLGLKVADMGNTASTNAKAWGDFGLKSSAAGLSSGLELQRLGGTLGASTVNSYNGITNAGSSRIQANNGTMTAQAAQDANNPWTTLGGALISGGLRKWMDS